VVVGTFCSNFHIDLHSNSAVAADCQHDCEDENSDRSEQEDKASNDAFSALFVLKVALSGSVHDFDRNVFLLRRNVLLLNKLFPDEDCVCCMVITP